ncbi:MAG: hypothetical protein K2N36_04855, partial [Ruminiclostridium sp.]|nr:hypothetical protein [Ruminiclostridium sp.]
PRYPNLYPFCLFFGMISFVFCCGALCGNIQYICSRKRGSDESGKGGSALGGVIEIAVTVLVFVGCSVGLDMVYNLVRT